MQQFLKNSLVATALLSSVSTTFASDEGSFLTIGLDIGPIYQLNANVANDEKDKESNLKKFLGSYFIEGNVSMPITDIFSAGLKTSFSQLQYPARSAIDALKNVLEISVHSCEDGLTKDARLFNDKGEPEDRPDQDAEAREGGPEANADAVADDEKKDNSPKKWLKKGLTKEQKMLIKPEFVNSILFHKEKLDGGVKEEYQLTDLNYRKSDGERESCKNAQVSEVLQDTGIEYLKKIDPNIGDKTMEALYNSQFSYLLNMKSITFMPFGQYDAFKSDSLDLSIYAGIGLSYNMYQLDISVIQGESKHTSSNKGTDISIDGEIGTKMCYKFSDSLAISGSITYNLKGISTISQKALEGILCSEHLGRLSNIKGAIGISYSI